MADLPKLFVLGDSISVGYGPFLKQYVAGVLAYDRKSGLEEALKDLDLPAGANGGDSRCCLHYLEGWLKRGGLPADYLLLNCGLHDLKWIRETKQYQVTVEEYASNLRKIVGVVRAMQPQLLWVRTTPVNYEWHHRNKPMDRREEDVDRYNAAADAIMKEAGAPICDLFAFQKNLNAGMSPDGVHFDAEAQEQQAAFIAGFLLAQPKC
jgi:lysophospholipase L1-like esterase